VGDRARFQGFKVSRWRPRGWHFQSRRINRDPGKSEAGFFSKFPTWPLLAVLIVHGPVSSITSSVPAGSVAERCLPSQWVTVTVAPIIPRDQESLCLRRPARPMRACRAGAHADSVRSLASWAIALNWPSELTSEPRPAWCQPTRRLHELSPLGRTRFSGRWRWWLAGDAAGLIRFRDPALTACRRDRFPSITSRPGPAEKGSPAFE